MTTPGPAGKKKHLTLINITNMPYYAPVKVANVKWRCGANQSVSMTTFVREQAICGGMCTVTSARNACLGSAHPGHIQNRTGWQHICTLSTVWKKCSGIRVTTPDSKQLSRLPLWCGCFTVCTKIETSAPEIWPQVVSWVDISVRSRQTLDVSGWKLLSECIRGTGGVNDDPGGGLSPSTRLIEKQIAANKACN